LAVLQDLPWTPQSLRRLEVTISGQPIGPSVGARLLHAQEIAPPEESCCMPQRPPRNQPWSTTPPSVR